MPKKKKYEQRTIYIESEMNKKIKLQSVLEGKSDTELIRKILDEYFKNWRLKYE